MEESFFEIVRECRQFGKEKLEDNHGGFNNANGRGSNGRVKPMGYEDGEKSAGCCKCSVM